MSSLNGGRRLVFTRNTRVRDESFWLRWALQNRIEVLVIPLCGRPGFFSRSGGAVFRRFDRLCLNAEREGLAIERGGWDLPGLLAQGFFSKAEWRRMEGGRRVRRYNFCATNPEGLNRVKNNARRIFEQCPRIGVFHLWPDRGAEKTWCSCPACRAFSWFEQYLMAVTAAADVLREINPGAGISYFAGSGEEGRFKGRPNMFSLPLLPGQDGAEAGGWFLAEPGRGVFPGGAR
jgi:hypothetical protein